MSYFSRCFRLRDESTEVRLKTMIVLKHLVLNEMVKVRGQISDLALCIVDDDERISCKICNICNVALPKF